MSSPDTPSLVRGSWLVAPSFIYGTIIVTAVMIVAEDTQSDLDVFLLTLASIAIVWVAHTFSEIVAGGPVASADPVPFGTVLRHALGNSAGLLAAAALPLALLLAGALGVDENVAYYAALAVSVLSLAVIGWFAVQRRGYIWPLRLLGALSSAVVGLLVVVLKAILK
jgi:hypothetical protein